MRIISESIFIAGRGRFAFTSNGVAVDTANEFVSAEIDVVVEPLEIVQSEVDANRQASRSAASQN
jgi:hypothetical protein